jgi:hypothetical protein
MRNRMNLARPSHATVVAFLALSVALQTNKSNGARLIIAESLMVVRVADKAFLGSAQIPARTDCARIGLPLIEKPSEVRERI